MKVVNPGSEANYGALMDGDRNVVPWISQELLRPVPCWGSIKHPRRGLHENRRVSFLQHSYLDSMVSHTFQVSNRFWYTTKSID